MASSTQNLAHLWRACCSTNPYRAKSLGYMCTCITSGYKKTTSECFFAAFRRPGYTEQGVFRPRGKAPSSATMMAALLSMRSAVIMAQMTMLLVTVFAMMRMMTMLNFVMDISLVHFHMYGASFCLTTENDTACCACYYCELDDSMFHIACTGLHALHPYKRTSKVFLFKI